MSDRPTVMLGDLEITLRDPGRHSLALDLLTAAQGSRPRALAAALGMAWLKPRTGRPKVQYSQCGYNAAAYGGQVLDALVQDGHDWRDILAAGDEAFVFLTAGLVDLHEAADAEDFTEPDGDSST